MTETQRKRGRPKVYNTPEERRQRANDLQRERYRTNPVTRQKRLDAANSYYHNNKRKNEMKQCNNCGNYADPAEARSLCHECNEWVAFNGICPKHKPLNKTNNE